MIRQLLRPLPQSARRAGGRAARRMERAAPLAEELRPVRAGLIGGQYRPLNAAAVQAIDSAVYQILEEIGLSQAPETGIGYMTAAGAIAGDDGRIRFRGRWSMTCWPRRRGTSRCMVRTRSMICCCPAAGYITALPERLFTSLMSRRTIIASRGCPIFMMLRAWSRRWTISTSFSARWWRGT